MITVEQPPFGSDPMDVYSSPLKREKKRFGEIFTMQVRERPEKPGRSLAVIWDERVSLVEGFENAYSYAVTFQEVGNVAGNHFHHEKQELWYPLIGLFTVILENVETKEKEEMKVNATDHKVIFVPRGIAHVVRAETNPAILLVTASSPQVDRDEFAYKIA